MKLNRGTLLSLAAVAAATALLSVAAKDALVTKPDPVGPVRVPAARSGKAPAVSASDRAGRATPIAPRPGKLLVVHFWATWCAPCVEEYPSLLAYWRAAKGDPRLALVTVSADRDWKTVDRFLGDKGAADGLEMLLDSDQKAASAWGTAKFPETWFVAPDGTVLSRAEGPLDWASADARKKIDALVAAVSGAPTGAVSAKPYPGGKS